MHGSCSGSTAPSMLCSPGKGVRQSQLHPRGCWKEAALPHVTFHLQEGLEERRDEAGWPNEHPSVPAGLVSIPRKVPAYSYSFPCMQQRSASSKLVLNLTAERTEREAINLGGVLCQSIVIIRVSNYLCSLLCSLC